MNVPGCVPTVFSYRWSCRAEAPEQEANVALDNVQYLRSWVLSVGVIGHA